jgi:hypothetical protein
MNRSECVPDERPVAIDAASPALRRSRQARVVWGSNVVTVGGDAPVRVQSMTNTDTVDVIGTAIQVKELALAGSEVVRITVNTPEAAQAVPYIREHLDRMGISVPLIGDFHYNGHRLLTEFPACAAALSKYRINPGNVGKGDKRDRQFAMMIEAAMRHDKPVRIGVNWGSLDQELLVTMMDENAARAEPWESKQVMYQALITSALQSASYARELGMNPDQILISCKVSGVQDLERDHHLLGPRLAGLWRQAHPDGVSDALLQKQRERCRRGDRALGAHAGLGQSEVERIVAATAECTIDADEILHAADLAADQDLIGIHAQFTRIGCRLERRGDQRLIHHLLGLPRLRSCRVLVHHRDVLPRRS